MVPDARFRHRDNEIAVGILATSNLAVLLGDALDKLAATLVGHEKRAKAVRLMLKDPLSGSEKTEYFVVITLTAAVRPKSPNHFAETSTDGEKHP
jgi:hypothetical protein